MKSLALLLTFFLSSPIVVECALNAYLRLKGAKQGAVPRNAADDGDHKKWIDILSWNHQVSVPFDAFSGLPTGKRQHKPFTILKRIDRTTPLILNMLINNENVQAVIHLIRENRSTGEETHFFTITLENAIFIRRNDTFVAEDNAAQEELSLNYQTITWTHEIASTEAEDDWEAAAV